MSSTRVVIDPKRVSDTITVVFDFVSKLAAGEYLVNSGLAVTTVVWSGVDANPSAILNGGAVEAGTQVSQSIKSGVAGVVYYLKASVGTSNNNTLSLGAFLTVIPDSL